MHPTWNIKGCIIQPGGVETEFLKGSMVVCPQHPAHSAPDSPSSQFRTMLQQPGIGIGSAEKMGKAIMRVADIPNPPLRIQLGSEANVLVKNTAMATIKDADKWVELSHTTNRDGVDVAAFMKSIGIVSD